MLFKRFSLNKKKKAFHILYVNLEVLNKVFSLPHLVILQHTLLSCV